MRSSPVSSRRRKRFAQFCALGFSALALSACVDASLGTKDEPALTSSWVRPNDPQEKIGAKEHPLVVSKYGGVYENTQAERLIAVIVGKLVAQSDDPSRVFKITLLDSPKINAFALPGGFLYVTRGLLALANDSSELAAVIAHEMAHVSSNHAIIRQDKLNSAEIGEQVVAEVLDGSRAGQVALAANKLRLANFSQKQELQADAIGIRMVGRAGYDAFAAARFLETMEQYQAFLSGKNKDVFSDSLSSSHPSTPQRVDLAKRQARFFGGPDIGDRARGRYLQGVDNLLYGDTADEGFVRGQEFLHSGLGIRFSAPQNFKIDNQSKAVLISGPQDIAVRFDAAVVSSRTSLADYLKSGWITGLVDETISEEKVGGLDSASAVALGEGWRFKVRILRNGDQVYRFITAAPQTNTNLDAVSRSITNSFKLLSASDIANLKPLRMKVIQSSAGQGEGAVVAKMRGVSKPAELFRLLNGLDAANPFIPGGSYKIITDR